MEKLSYSYYFVEGNVSREVSLDNPLNHDHTFKACIIGPSGVGKTSLKMNLMSSKLDMEGYTKNLKVQ